MAVETLTNAIYALQTNYDFF